MTTAILRLQEAGRGGEEGGEAEPGLVSVPLLEKAEPRLGRRHRSRICPLVWLMRSTCRLTSLVSSDKTRCPPCYW